MSEEIRNCQFSFKCPKTWDALETTPVETQRYCGECQKVVHYCRTASELQWAIVRNLCVAVETPEKLSTAHSNDEEACDIGLVSPEYFVDKNN